MLQLIQNAQYSWWCVRLERVSKKWRTEKFLKAQWIIPYARIYLPLAGEAFGQLGTTRLHFRPGYIYLIPPYANIRVWCDDFMLKYWIHFNVRLPGTSYDLFSMRKIPCELPMPDPTLSIELFKILIRIQSPLPYMMKQPEGLAKNEADSAMNLLLSPFYRELIRKKETMSVKNRRIMEILLFLEEHFKEPMSLERLADKVKLNPTYLSNLFAAETGIPLIRYINRRRVETAMEMLRNPQFAVKEIADHVGFDNPLVFTRLFKRHVGLSPQDYRKTEQIRREEEALREEEAP